MKGNKISKESLIEQKNKLVYVEFLTSTLDGIYKIEVGVDYIGLNSTSVIGLVFDKDFNQILGIYEWKR